MVAFITLSCPSCGNKLQITEDIDRFACAACGTEHVVIRTGGTVTLLPVIESMSKVQAESHIIASELAIIRIKDEIDTLINKITVIKEKMYEREKSTLAWDTFGGLFSCALRQIAKEKGVELGLTGTLYKDCLDWHMKRDTRLNKNDYDLLVNKLCKFPVFFPKDVLMELKNIDISITKKKNELKQRQMIYIADKSKELHLIINKKNIKKLQKMLEDARIKMHQDFEKNGRETKHPYFLQLTYTLKVGEGEKNWLPSLTIEKKYKRWYRLYPSWDDTFEFCVDEILSIDARPLSNPIPIIESCEHKFYLYSQYSGDSYATPFDDVHRQYLDDFYWKHLDDFYRFVCEVADNPDGWIKVTYTENRKDIYDIWPEKLIFTSVLRDKKTGEEIESKKIEIY